MKTTGVGQNDTSPHANRILLNYELHSTMDAAEREQIDEYYRELELKRSGKVSW